jgi:hypothetical protein
MDRWIDRYVELMGLLRKELAGLPREKLTGLPRQTENHEPEELVAFFDAHGASIEVCASVLACERARASVFRLNLGARVCVWVQACL